jgi:hypothetical protein
MSQEIFSTLTTQDQIQTWLDKVGIKNYTITSDLIVNVDDSVDIKSLSLTHFPVQFGVINGDFICSQNQLISLKGAPYEIKGNFSCQGNQLTTLEYCPKKVKSSIDLGNNKLVSLKGLPNICNGDLDLRSNQLTSLEGCSEIVLNTFICSFNKLYSLEFGPKEAFSYICSSNQLTSLDYAPEIVPDMFVCSNNQLTSLKGSLKEAHKITVGDNPLTSFKGSTLKAYEIHIFRTPLSKISSFQEIEHIEAKYLIDITNNFNEPILTTLSNNYQSSYRQPVYEFDFKALKERMKIKYEKQRLEEIVDHVSTKRNLKI